jgi:uncharacterized protein YndB with AHSA1/START domain
VESETDAGDVVTVTRILRAPPHEVFAAWTQPAMVRRWAALASSIDPRAGARVRRKIASVRGLHLVSGDYREFVPARRVVMTWTHESPGNTSSSESRVTVDLNQTGPNTTELRVSEQPIPPADRAAAESAWHGMLDVLDPLLAPLADEPCAWRVAG